MAINNPYIPGDPYSYDLKWLVAKVKEILAQLGTLDEAIEAKIFEGFLEHSIVQFKTVPEMLAADIKDGSIVLTLGYHEEGDQGALFYLVKDFNPGQCSLDYFLTMDNNAQIAIPVIVTPYVTPEMFGAYGDGVTDDADALETALSFDKVKLTKEYAIGHTVEVRHTTFINGGKLKALVPLENGIVYVNANNVSIDRVNFEGTGVETTLPHGWYYSAVYAYQADGLSVTNCHIENMEGSGIFIRETNGSNIDGNVIENMAGKEGSCIAFGYGTNVEKISNAVIHANTCDAKSRFGIHIQGWGEDFIVSENIVKNCYGYGIMAYLNANGQDVLSRVVISDNVVENIHYNPESGIYDGMGIYCQTVQGLTVTGNIVKNALLDRPDTSGPDRALEPAAISLNGSTELICSSNVVINSTIDGIGVVNVFAESKASILESNIIVEALNPIYIRSTKHLNVNGNYIGGNCSTAITLYSTSTVITEDINIIGNIVEGTNVTAISIYEGTGSESRNITVKSNTLKGSSANMLGITHVNGLQIDANTFTSTPNGGTNAYILSINHAEDVVITNNVTLQDDANTFGRGFNLANIAGGLVANNRISHISQIAYSIVQTNNSNVEFLGNITPRSPYPFYTAIAIGQDPMNDNYKVVTSGTSAPASGTYDRGSICFNKTPAPGGFAGWICTSGGTPGTWKAFGKIEN